MRFTGQLQALSLDLASYKQALHAHLSEALAQSAAHWLHATAEGPVPVYSGASRATFSPLASHVGYVLSLTPLNVAPNRIDVGIGAGTGTFVTDSSKWDYHFTYSTTLKQLLINEYNNANTYINPATGKPYFRLTFPGPYHFQEKGRQAFQQFVVGLELLKVAPYVGSQTITV